MRLIQRLRLVRRIVIFVVSTLAFWLALEFEVFCLRKKRLDAINKWVPHWSRFNLRAFGVTIEARGEYITDNELYPAMDSEGRGRIFIANHRSGMDIPVLFSVAETHVISRHDLASWPLLGRAAKRIGTLFVDRDSKKSGASVLRAVDHALERGEGVAMFPEGTAHDGDEVRTFRPGAFNAARRSGSQIIPIGIAYGHPDAYYSKLSFVKHMTRIAMLSKLTVAVEVGQPLCVGEQSALEVKDLAKLRVQELVQRARTRLEN